MCVFFFFQAEDGIRDLVRSRGLGDVYKRQSLNGKQVLTPDQVARMAKSQPNASYGLAARTNSAGRYGPFMGPQAFGHTGWNGTSFVVDPVSRMWIVGLANVSLGQKVEGETKPLNNFLGAFAAMGEAVANNYSALANQ